METGYFRENFNFGEKWSAFFYFSWYSICQWFLHHMLLEYFCAFFFIYFYLYFALRGNYEWRLRYDDVTMISLWRHSLQLHTNEKSSHANRISRSKKQHQSAFKSKFWSADFERILELWYELDQDLYHFRWDFLGQILGDF